MTEDEKKEIAQLVKEASKQAVEETFKVLGIDVNDFDHVKEFRDDHTWVRRYRRVSESVGSKILITITTVVTTGVAAVVWAYITGTKN
jgi:hypothetical protein